MGQGLARLTGRNTAKACQMASYSPNSRMVLMKISSTWAETSHPQCISHKFGGAQHDVGMPTIGHIC
jgi:hypothetical protein